MFCNLEFVPGLGFWKLELRIARISFADQKMRYKRKLLSSRCSNDSPQINVASSELGPHLSEKPHRLCLKGFSFVIAPGFEPGTDSLEGCCSIQLSYATIGGAKVRIFMQYLQVWEQI